MATLIPDTPRDCPAGERQVFERFERDLRDQPSWVVLHSLGLVHHEHKVWGEIDFVVLSTKGIFVLEVKGGQVACRDGQWIYSRGGESYARKESPWAQASSAMFALKKRIGDTDKDLAKLLFGFGVVMPRESFLATGPEIDQGTLLDKRNFGRNLGFYLGDLQRHWENVYQERHGSVPRKPTAEEIRKLRTLLRPDVESSVSLGSELNGLDMELIQLTNEQVRASRRMASNPRTIVRGRAGTGKTVLAVERAKQLARDGYSVRYLCFNQLLARHVALNLGADPLNERVQVGHIHSLFREVIVGAGLQDRLDIPGISNMELFGKVFPETFVDAALSTEIEATDVLVIDEAQDMLTPENLDALDLLVKGGLRHGRWHLFMDPMQNIYQVESEAVAGRLEDISVAYDDLFQNCRNTRQIAQQTSIISGVDMAIEGAIMGVPCECYFYNGRSDALAYLNREIARLVSQEVGTSDIIILSTRRLENSLLAGVDTIAGLPLRELRSVQDGPSCHFTTMHAFKGLERNIVIAVDLNEMGDEQWSMLHYAGLSRARTLLIPLVAATARDRYDKQAAQFGRRMAAASRSPV